MLVSAYRRALTRRELSTSLTALQLRSGFTRVVILERAVQLRLSFSRRRPWAPEEIALLESLAGSYSPASISRRLKRTFASVKAKLKQLQISARVTEGYSQTDLAELLGASPVSIRRWGRIGWLPVVNGRISEAAVVKFLRLHPHEYQLRRVDEAWFKGLLFPAFNSAEVGPISVAQPASTVAATPINSRAALRFSIVKPPLPPGSRTARSDHSGPRRPG